MPRIAALTALAAALWLGPVAPSHAAPARETQIQSLTIFSESDRREIEKWLRLGKALTGEDRDRKKLPPGLAKREHLPPGLAKRDTLPPGLAKRSLAPDLESRLSRLPKGYSRQAVGDDVLLIEEATGIVLDILKGVGLGR